MKARYTIRLRLALVFFLLFMVTGGGLLAVSHQMVRNSLILEEGTTERRVVESYGFAPEDVERFYALELPTPAELDGGTPAGERLTVGEVIVGVQGEIRSSALDRLLVGTTVALVVLGVVAIGLGWFMAGRVLAPVTKLTATAKRISVSNLDRRIALDGPPDELKELADTLDEMISRLEDAFHNQRRFAADVSHELRTPISIIRAEADVALAADGASESERELATRVRDAADRCERLMDSLLALSRGESPLQTNETIDLAGLVGDVVGARTGAADRVEVELDLDLETAEVDGDPWLLERLVANLVDNALVYNRPGGWLHVTVGRNNGNCDLSVENTGRVLDAATADHLFEPFARGSDTPGDDHVAGFGLGLAIVRAVTRAHGGSVSLEARDEGGMSIRVQLPSSRRTPVEAH